MSNMDFFETICETGSLFYDSFVFKLNYMPKTYKFRGGQWSRMVLNSKDLENNEAPDHMMLLGTVATGKTSLMKEYFRQAEKQYPDLICLYIDCHSENTEYKIYSEIHKKLINGSDDLNGWQFSKLKKEIMDHLISHDLILVVGLDDYELIKSNKEINNTLYGLLRAGEKYEGVKLSVIVATSEYENVKLHKKVTSVFQSTKIHFPSYSQSEIFYILKQRCSEGFYDGVIADNVINYVADLTFDKGDLRHGIRLLVRAGRNAEEDNSPKILAKHVY
jgi:archaeal cell division control protein 6